jgi:hypothetical protein
VLHVLLTNGKWVKILPEYEVDIDTRYGDDNEVRDAEDFGIDPDDEPKWEYENEEEEEDNPAKIAKKLISDIFDKVKAMAKDEEYIGEPGSLNYLFGIPLSKRVIVG